MIELLCYFTIEKAKESPYKYIVFGGGYGHGIGMSQNGAKNMAQQGLSYMDILGASYQNTTIEILDGKGEEANE